MWRISIMIGLLIGLMGGTLPGRAQQSAAPFVYYYSNEDRAVIIERADGADRQEILLHDLVGERDKISGLAWSNTGLWLAGGAANRGKNPDLVWIARYDGVVRLSLQIPDLVALDGSSWVWSPTGDFLLVNYIGSNIRGRAAVFSVDSNRPLLAFPVSEWLGAPAVWSSDGQSVYYFEQIGFSEIPDIDQCHTKTIFLALDGMVTEDSENCPKTLYPVIPDRNAKPRISQDSEQNTLIIEDTANSTITEVPAVLPHLVHSDWSPDGQYAVIYTEQEPGSVGYGYMLWILSNHTLRLVTEEAHVANFRDDGCDEVTPRQFWTPDSQRVLILTTNAQLYWLWADSGRIDDTGLEYLNQAQYPWDLRVQWLSDGTGYIMWDYALWQYDLTANSSSPEPLWYSSSFAVSNDNRFIAMIGMCDSELDNPHPGKCIVGRQTGSEVSLPKHEFARADQVTGGFVCGMNLGQVQWHPTEDWVRFTELISVDGFYSTGGRMESFANASGQTYRELMAEWLPEQVPIN